MSEANRKEEMGEEMNGRKVNGRKDAARVVSSMLVVFARRCIECAIGRGSESSQIRRSER